MFKLRRKKYIPTHKRVSELAVGDRILVFGEYLTIFRTEPSKEVQDTILHVRNVHKPFYGNTIVMEVPNEMFVETYNWNQN